MNLGRIVQGAARKVGNIAERNLPEGAQKKLPKYIQSQMQIQKQQDAFLKDFVESFVASKKDIPVLNLTTMKYEA